MSEHSGLLAAVMDTVHDAILTIDTSGIVQFANKSTENLLGYDRAEIIGNNVKMIMPEPHRHQHDGYLHNYQQTGDAKVIGTSRRVEALHKDGHLIPVELFVGKIDALGDGAYVGVLRDISVRVDAEQKAQAYLRDLEKSNQELDDFAYIASHDLKEPLRGIYNHTRFLREDYGELLGEDGGRRLDRLLDLSKRLETLISELLYFSRLGRTDLAFEVVDMQALLTEVTDTLHDHLQESSAEVVVDTSIPPVYAHQQQIREVFHNLIVNAVKYNKNEKKAVKIFGVDSIEHNGLVHKDVIAVQDNGIGIKEQFYEDVFRIFKRLNSEKKFGKGTGAGLTFVKKIIDNHKGAIWIDSEYGNGSTFYIALPHPEQENNNE